MSDAKTGGQLRRALGYGVVVSVLLAGALFVFNMIIDNVISTVETVVVPCQHGGLWSGNKCDCIGPWTGQTCGECACVHGQCDQLHISAPFANSLWGCRCPDNWLGAYCDLCTSERDEEQNCNGDCLEGYTGSKCESRCVADADFPAIVENSGDKYTEEVDLWIAGGNLNACSGHGVCENTTNVCLCEEFYFPSADGKSDCKRTCRRDPSTNIACYGHGVCTETNNNVHCVCQEGYHLRSDCSLACPGMDIEWMKKSCSERGVCSLDGDEAVCDCTSEVYIGDACQYKCPTNEDGDSGVPCNGHGVCALTTGPFVQPKCTCAEGWKGPSCECNDAQTCSGHGTCTDTGVCDCDPLFRGKRCNTCVERRYGSQCTLQCDERKAADESTPAEDIGCNSRGVCVVADFARATESVRCACSRNFDFETRCKECKRFYYPKIGESGLADPEEDAAVACQAFANRATCNQAGEPKLGFSSDASPGAPCLCDQPHVDGNSFCTKCRETFFPDGGDMSSPSACSKRCVDSDDHPAWMEGVFTLVCKNQGVCDPTGELCVCPDGYSGKDCSIACGGDTPCSGHGQCVSNILEQFLSAEVKNSIAGGASHHCQCDPQPVLDDNELLKAFTGLEGSGTNVETTLEYMGDFCEYSCLHPGWLDSLPCNGETCKILPLLDNQGSAVLSGCTQDTDCGDWDPEKGRLVFLDGNGDEIPTSSLSPEQIELRGQISLQNRWSPRMGPFCKVPTLPLALHTSNMVCTQRVNEEGRTEATEALCEAKKTKFDCLSESGNCKWTDACLEGLEKFDEFSYCYELMRTERPEALRSENCTSSCDSDSLSELDWAGVCDHFTARVPAQFQSCSSNLDDLCEESADASADATSKVQSCGGTLSPGAKNMQALDAASLCWESSDEQDAFNSPLAFEPLLDTGTARDLQARFDPALRELGIKHGCAVQTRDVQSSCAQMRSYNSPMLFDTPAPFLYSCEIDGRATLGDTDLAGNDIFCGVKTTVQELSPFVLQCGADTLPLQGMTVLEAVGKSLHTGCHLLAASDLHASGIFVGERDAAGVCRKVLESENPNACERVCGADSCANVGTSRSGVQIFQCDRDDPSTVSEESCLLGTFSPTGGEGGGQYRCAVAGDLLKPESPSSFLPCENSLVLHADRLGFGDAKTSGLDGTRDVVDETVQASSETQTIRVEFDVEIVSASRGAVNVLARDGVLASVLLRHFGGLGWDLNGQAEDDEPCAAGEGDSCKTKVGVGVPTHVTLEINASHATATFGDDKAVKTIAQGVGDFDGVSVTGSARIKQLFVVRGDNAETCARLHRKTGRAATWRQSLEAASAAPPTTLGYCANMEKAWATESCDVGSPAEWDAVFDAPWEEYCAYGDHLSHFLAISDSECTTNGVSRQSVVGCAPVLSKFSTVECARDAMTFDWENDYCAPLRNDTSPDLLTEIGCDSQCLSEVKQSDLSAFCADRTDYWVGNEARPRFPSGCAATDAANDAWRSQDWRAWCLAKASNTAEGICSAAACDCSSNGGFMGGDACELSCSLGSDGSVCNEASFSGVCDYPDTMENKINDFYADETKLVLAKRASEFQGVCKCSNSRALAKDGCDVSCDAEDGEPVCNQRNYTEYGRVWQTSACHAGGTGVCACLPPLTRQVQENVSDWRGNKATVLSFEYGGLPTTAPWDEQFRVRAAQGPESLMIRLFNYSESTWRAARHKFEEQPALFPCGDRQCDFSDVVLAQSLYTTSSFFGPTCSRRCPSVDTGESLAKYEGVCDFADPVRADRLTLEACQNECLDEWRCNFMRFNNITSDCRLYESCAPSSASEGEDVFWYERKLTSTPEMTPCSGRGACTMTGTCVCDSAKFLSLTDPITGKRMRVQADERSSLAEVPTTSLDTTGYRSDDCSLVCPGFDPEVSDMSTVCSGHGICTRSAVCQCGPGFTGQNCEYPCPSMDSVEDTTTTCSGHGTCSESRMFPVESSVEKEDVQQQYVLTEAWRKWINACKENQEVGFLVLPFGNYPGMLDQATIKGGVDCEAVPQQIVDDIKDKFTDRPVIEVLAIRDFIELDTERDLDSESMEVEGRSDDQNHERVGVFRRRYWNESNTWQSQNVFVAGYAEVQVEDGSVYEKFPGFRCDGEQIGRRETGLATAGECALRCEDLDGCACFDYQEHYHSAFLGGCRLAKAGLLHGFPIHTALQIGAENGLMEKHQDGDLTAFEEFTETYVVLQSDKSCRATTVNIGDNVASVEDCAQVCANRYEDGCRYFTWSSDVRRCSEVKTSSSACDEGFNTDPSGFFAVSVENQGSTAPTAYHVSGSARLFPKDKPRGTVSGSYYGRARAEWVIGVAQCSCSKSYGFGYWSGFACQSCEKFWGGESCTKQCPGVLAGEPCFSNGVCLWGSKDGLGVPGTFYDATCLCGDPPAPKSTDLSLTGTWTVESFDLHVEATFQRLSAQTEYFEDPNNYGFGDATCRGCVEKRGGKNCASQCSWCLFSGSCQFSVSNSISVPCSCTSNFYDSQNGCAPHGFTLFNAKIALDVGGLSETNRATRLEALPGLDISVGTFYDDAVNPSVQTSLFPSRRFTSPCPNVHETNWMLDLSETPSKACKRLGNCRNQGTRKMIVNGIPPRYFPLSCLELNNGGVAEGTAWESASRELFFTYEEKFLLDASNPSASEGYYGGDGTYASFSRYQLNDAGQEVFKDFTLEQFISNCRRSCAGQPSCVGAVIKRTYGTKNAYCYLSQNTFIASPSQEFISTEPNALFTIYRIKREYDFCKLSDPRNVAVLIKENAACSASGQQTPGARLPSSDPLYDSDAAQECMNRCVALSNSPCPPSHPHLGGPFYGTQYWCYAIGPTTPGGPYSGPCNMYHSGVPPPSGGTWGSNQAACPSGSQPTYNSFWVNPSGVCYCNQQCTQADLSNWNGANSYQITRPDYRWCSLGSVTYGEIDLCADVALTKQNEDATTDSGLADIDITMGNLGARCEVDVSSDGENPQWEARAGSGCAGMNETKIRLHDATSVMLDYAKGANALVFGAYKTGDFEASVAKVPQNSFGEMRPENPCNGKAGYFWSITDKTKCEHAETRQTCDIHDWKLCPEAQVSSDTDLHSAHDRRAMYPHRIAVGGSELEVTVVELDFTFNLQTIDYSDIDGKISDEQQKITDATTQIEWLETYRGCGGDYCVDSYNYYSDKVGDAIDSYAVWQDYENNKYPTCSDVKTGTGFLTCYIFWVPYDCNEYDIFEWQCEEKDEAKEKRLLYEADRDERNNAKTAWEDTEKEYSDEKTKKTNAQNLKAQYEQDKIDMIAGETCSPDRKCDLCQGNCDNDSECRDGLACLSSISSNKATHYCGGSAPSNAYCMPPTNADVANKPYLVGYAAHAGSYTTKIVEVDPSSGYVLQQYGESHNDLSISDSAPDDSASLYDKRSEPRLVRGATALAGYIFETGVAGNVAREGNALSSINEPRGFRVADREECKQLCEQTAGCTAASVVKRTIDNGNFRRNNGKYCECVAGTIYPYSSDTSLSESQAVEKCRSACVDNDSFRSVSFRIGVEDHLMDTCSCYKDTHETCPLSVCKKQLIGANWVNFKIHDRYLEVDTSKPFKCMLHTLSVPQDFQCSSLQNNVFYTDVMLLKPERCGLCKAMGMTPDLLEDDSAAQVRCSRLNKLDEYCEVFPTKNAEGAYSWSDKRCPPTRPGFEKMHTSIVRVGESFKLDEMSPYETISGHPDVQSFSHCESMCVSETKCVAWHFTDVLSPQRGDDAVTHVCELFSYVPPMISTASERENVFSGRTRIGTVQRDFSQVEIFMDDGDFASCDCNDDAESGGYDCGCKKTSYAPYKPYELDDETWGCSNNGVCGGTGYFCVCDDGYEWAWGPASNNHGEGYTCRACAAGTYKNSDVKHCTSCPLGTYQDQTGQAQCTACDEPQPTTGATGAKSLEACLTCPSGRVSGSLAEKTHTDFLNLNYDDNAVLCVPCGVGRFDTGFGDAAASTTRTCQDCPPGKTTSTYGMSACDVTTISGDCDEPGMAWESLDELDPEILGGSRCMLCAQGRYRDPEKSLFCQDCPTGYGSKLGTFGCQICPSGYYSETAADMPAECTACGSGRYSDAGEGQGGDDICKGCAVGKYSTDVGQTSISACKRCDPGYYGASTGASACTDCAAGRYEDELGSTACNACEAGRYSTAVRLSTPEVYDSQTLPPGLICIPSMVVSTGNVLKVPLGGSYSYTQDECANLCVAHDGFVTNSVDGDCYCIVGDMESCRTWVSQDEIQHRYYKSETVWCKACDFGKYGANQAQNSGSGCALCPAGRYNDQGVGLVECKSCAAGLYQNEEGQLGCKECPAGFFLGSGSSAAVMGCTSCPEGKFRDGITTGAQCDFCRYPNKYCLTPQEYEAATEGDKGRHTERCAGYGYPNADKTACVPCQAGMYGDGTTPCKQCPAGYIQPQKRGGSDCTICNDEVGHTLLNRWCLHCDEGKYHVASDDDVAHIKVPLYEFIYDLSCDSYSSNYIWFETISLDECAAMCYQHPDCSVFTFYRTETLQAEYYDYHDRCLLYVAGPDCSLLENANTYDHTINPDENAKTYKILGPGTTGIVPLFLLNYEKHSDGNDMATEVSPSSDETCFDCQTGRYRPSGDTSGLELGHSEKECKLCPAGTYLDETGKTSVAHCKVCPAHTYGSNAGLSTASACENCPIGTAKPNTATSYHYVTSGTCEKRGYATIDSESDCRAAYTYLNFENVDSDGDIYRIYDERADLLSTGLAAGCTAHELQNGEYFGSSSFDGKYQFRFRREPVEGWESFLEPWRENQQYVVQSSGTCEYPITTPEECEAAHEALGQTGAFVGSAYYANNIPPNCWTVSGGGGTTYWNINTNSVGACGSGGRSCICKTRPQCGSEPLDWGWDFNCLCRNTPPACSACPSGQGNTGAGQPCAACPAGQNSAGIWYPDIGMGYFCRQCSSGQYQNEAGKTGCKTCPAGWWKTGSYATTCSACGAGRYSEYTARTSSSSCKACLVGTFGPSTGASACINCTPGKYSSGQGWHVCTACPAGYYQNGNGADSCKSCPVGKSRGNTGGGACQDCAAGRYAASTGASACAACPAGWYAPVMSQGCSSCPAGTYNPSAGAAGCTECPAGRYTGVRGVSACAACPVGFYYDSAGATACTSCRIGKYNDQDGLGYDGCTNCPEGKYQDTRGADSCLDCPAGRYYDGTGLNNVNWCKYCSAGLFQDATGQTSSASCKDCPSGWYSRTGWERCLNCDPGRYSTTDSCTNCVAGKYSFIYEMKSSGTCDEYITTFAECEAARTALGLPDPGLGQNAWTIYPKGCFSTNSGSHVYFNTHTASTTNCGQPTGWSCVCKTPSSVSSGSTGCSNCPAGKYSQTSASACTTCPIGKYAATPGTGSCTSCSAGKASASGAIVCTNCVAGKYSPTGASACTACPIGKYAATPGTSSCTTCAAGKASVTGAIVCTNCVAGKYSPTGAGACVNCVAGKYSTAGAAFCTKCPAGYYNWFGAANLCYECFVGKYTTTTGNTDCTDCPTGKYAASQGASSCTSCAAGKYGTKTGAANSDTATSYALWSTGTCESRGFEQIHSLAQCEAAAASQGRTILYNNAYTSGTRPRCFFYDNMPDHLSYNSHTQEATVLTTGDMNTPGGIVCQKLACTTCPAGYFAGIAGADACAACAIGKYQLNGNRAICDQECGPNYEMKSSGTCDAYPTGYITSLEGCEAARTKLGLSDPTVGAPNSPTFPRGCYSKYGGSEVYFNSDTSNTQCTAERNCICESSNPSIYDYDAQTCVACTVSICGCDPGYHALSVADVSQTQYSEADYFCGGFVMPSPLIGILDIADAPDVMFLGSTIPFRPYYVDQLFEKSKSDLWIPPFSDSANPLYLEDKAKECFQRCAHDHAKQFAPYKSQDTRYVAGVNYFMLDQNNNCMCVRQSGCDARTTPGQDFYGSSTSPVTSVTTYEVSSTVYTDVCVACGAAGKYQDQANQTTCKECPAGRYTFLDYGATECKLCPAGFIGLPESLQNIYYYDNKIHCYACDDGTGKYQDEAGQTSCKSCPAGQSSLCTDCGSGDTDKHAGSTTCQTL